MKYRICLIDNDSLYIERFVGLISKNYKNGVVFTIYGDESEYLKKENNEEFDAAFIGKTDSQGEEYFEMLGYEEKKILKYQKTNEIWNQMKNLCEKKKMGTLQRKDSINVGDGVISYQIKNNAFTDKVAYQMIKNNDISGLVKIIEINEKEIKYDVKGIVPLSELIESGINNTVILNILKQIIEICNTLDEYMLSLDQVLLQTQYIFVEKDNMQVKLCYCPTSLNTENNKTIIINNDGKSTFVENFEVDDLDTEKTEVFDSLQEIARQSMERKAARQAGRLLPGEPIGTPYLIRRKNNERIDINRDIFKIGKEREYVDYVIEDNQSISRSHADIVRRNDGFYIIDHNSLNHTYVNGTLLEPKKYIKINKNDLIVLADEAFEFFI